MYLPKLENVSKSFNVYSQSQKDNPNWNFLKLRTWSTYAPFLQSTKTLDLIYVQVEWGSWMMKFYCVRDWKGHSNGKGLVGECFVQITIWLAGIHIVSINLDSDCQQLINFIFSSLMFRLSDRSLILVILIYKGNNRHFDLWMCN